MRFLMQRGEPWAVVASKFAACGEMLMLHNSAIRSAIVFNSFWLYGSIRYEVEAISKGLLDTAGSVRCQDQREISNTFEGGTIDTPAR